MDTIRIMLETKLDVSGWTRAKRERFVLCAGLAVKEIHSVRTDERDNRGMIVSLALEAEDSASAARLIDRYRDTTADDWWTAMSAVRAVVALNADKDCFHDPNGAFCKSLPGGELWIGPTDGKTVMGDENGMVQVDFGDKDNTMVHSTLMPVVDLLPFLSALYGKDMTGKDMIERL